jgi:hypothetical protein
VKSITQLTLGTSLAISPVAWSIPLSTIDGQDTPSATTTAKNSGAAITSVLEISLDEFSQQQTAGTATDRNEIENEIEPSVFTNELGAPVDWLLIKIGNSSGSPEAQLRFDDAMDYPFRGGRHGLQQQELCEQHRKNKPRKPARTNDRGGVPWHCSAFECPASNR